MFFMGSDTSAASVPSADDRLLEVARRTARIVPWVMGTLSAGLREQGAGIHASQFKVLMTMHHAPCSPSELAKRMEVSMPTVSRTLAVLERRGLIERATDPDDRRRVTLTMTEDGREALRRVRDLGIRQLAGPLGEATDEELDRIDAGMQALAAVFERTHEGRPGCAHHHTEGGGHR